MRAKFRTRCRAPKTEPCAAKGLDQKWLATFIFGKGHQSLLDPLENVSTENCPSTPLASRKALAGS